MHVMHVKYAQQDSLEIPAPSVTSEAFVSDYNN